MTKPWTKRLFLPAENPSSFGNIVAWWELRRIAFNTLVGAVGIVSFIVNLWLWTTYIQKPGEDDGFGPLVPVIVFGILANLFYTSGWIVEGLSLVIRRHGSAEIGPRLFKLGLGFSLVLASLPGLVLAVEVAFKALRHS
jgi:hypothetical protein